MNPELFIRFLLCLASFGAGFLLACYGAAKIVVENKELKDKLAKITEERDRLKESAKVIEIKDHRKEAADITGNYFTEF